MATGKDEIERSIAHACQINHVGAEEFSLYSKNGGAIARHIELSLGDVDTRDPGAQPGQSEDRLVIAAAKHGDTLAGNIVQPIQLGGVEGQRRVFMTPLPDAARIGVIRPGGSAGVPPAAIGFMKIICHRKARAFDLDRRTPPAPIADYFFWAAALFGLRLWMWPLSVPAVGSITALISA